MAKPLSRQHRPADSEPRSKSDGHAATGPEFARLITKTELRRIVPYTPQHILRLEKRGLFPRRIQVGPNRVTWLLAEIEDWIGAKIAERDAAHK